MHQPSQEILEKYADLLVNFALGSGEGISEGDVVELRCHEVAKPLYFALNRAVIKAGGHVITNYKPSPTEKQSAKRDFYQLASDEQLEHFPDKYLRGLVDEIDHLISIIADTDKEELKDVAPEKMMKRGQALKPYQDWLYAKEHESNFSWTLAAYGTEAMAAEAELSIEEYWEEIIKACYLDKDDPVEEWKSIYKEINEIVATLNELPIETIHVESENIDLKIKIGERRQWIGGGGSNIPSYEIFTSPDWRGTEGTIGFNQPLYRYGNLVKGIQLTFKEGKVVKASAEKNEEVLKEMIATEGADKVGEFSLTDRRFSRISKFMADTLFDENMGAKHGNTHIALGRAYKKCIDGNPEDISKKEWEELGFNDSSVHTDIVSTEPRTATATLKDGSKKVIYENGEFQV